MTDVEYCYLFMYYVIYVNVTSVTTYSE